MWLDHLDATDICNSTELTELKQEANELVAIFTAAQKTAKRKRGRGQ